MNTIPRNPMFFSDLDRTLFYSANALLLDMDDTAAPALVVSEVYQGRPLSFITERARALLKEISGAIPFIPVTTRTTAQYRRIRFPGAEAQYAVTTNGGCILHHGVPDAEWETFIRSQIGTTSATVDEIRQYLLNPRFGSWLLRLRDAEELFLYAIVERDLIPDEVLESVTKWCADRDWTVSLQGRKLYFVPAHITKVSAVSEVARRLGEGPLIAAGDSLLDLGMLQLADHGFRPAHGELHQQGVSHESMLVTSAQGVMAGEEILGAVHDLVFARYGAPSATNAKVQAVASIVHPR